MRHAERKACDPHVMQARFHTLACIVKSQVYSLVRSAG